LDSSEFAGVDKYPQKKPARYRSVYGKVRVDRNNDQFDVHAHGYFVDAVSEGGLQYGGGSTGSVEWKAHEKLP